MHRSLRLLLAMLPLAALGASSVAPRHPLPVISAMVAAVDPSRLAATDRRLVAFGTRNDFSDTSSTTTHGVFAARDWIRQQFEAIAATTGGRMTVAYDTYVQPKIKRTPRAVTESSVIATLRGDQPGRVYVMSSHYDDCDGNCTDGKGVAPGADDNGSGVSAVLEAARVMAPTHFHGTIIFACFDGEELGLWGSDHFARELRAKGVSVLADLNNDIIGNSTGGNGVHAPMTVRVFSQALPAGTNVNLVNLIGSENDSPSRELSRFAAQTIPLYVAGFRVEQIFRADRFLRGGDEESFTAQGYPAIRFVEANENFTHQHQNVRVSHGVQYGDLPQYIDPQYLARVTQANVATLASLALGPAPPRDVRLVTAHLGYDATLRWKPAADATAYEVVWRATDAPQWQHVTSAGNATQITVPVSEDDDILGVRSVAANGLRSPAVYPFTVRR